MIVQYYYMYSVNTRFILLKQERTRPGEKENILTWKSIIINVPKGCHAFPKVCVVGIITIQNTLLFHNSLANRK